MLDQFNRQLALGQALTDEQVALAVTALVDEAVTTPAKAEFLTTLARKGETTAEIAAFARALRTRSLVPELDHLTTFNISTTVAILAAAAGVTVAKHGNRASTSMVGSADVMEALGIPYDLGPEAAARSLAEHRFAFFFAPKYHPAFRHITPARRLCAERGQATVFNYLGPLLNPARPSAMLIGVPRPALCEPFARVLQALGARRAMVVSGAVPPNPTGSRYLDELSPLGPTSVAEFYQPHGLACSDLDPALFPLQPAALADLRGGDRAANAAIIQRILRGEERGPKRDAVLLNASAALFVAGRATSLQAGWDLAAGTIDGGQAGEKLRELSGK